MNIIECKSGLVVNGVHFFKESNHHDNVYSWDKAVTDPVYTILFFYMPKNTYNKLKESLCEDVDVIYFDKNYPEHKMVFGNGGVIESSFKENYVAIKLKLICRPSLCELKLNYLKYVKGGLL